MKTADALLVSGDISKSVVKVFFAFPVRPSSANPVVSTTLSNAGFSLSADFSQITCFSRLQRIDRFRDEWPIGLQVPAHRIWRS